MDQPDPKKHQLISFVKSGIRIAGCVVAAVMSPFYPSLAVSALATSMGIAEMVGIYEELV